MSKIPANKCLNDDDDHRRCFARDEAGKCTCLNTTTFTGDCPFYKSIDKYYLDLAKCTLSAC